MPTNIDCSFFSCYLCHAGIIKCHPKNLKLITAVVCPVTMQPCLQISHPNNLKIYANTTLMKIDQHTQTDWNEIVHERKPHLHSRWHQCRVVMMSVAQTLSSPLNLSISISSGANPSAIAFPIAFNICFFIILSKQPACIWNPSAAVTLPLFFNWKLSILQKIPLWSTSLLSGITLIRLTLVVLGIPSPLLRTGGKICLDQQKCQLFHATHGGYHPHK